MNKTIFLKLLSTFILLCTLNAIAHSQNFDTQLNFSDTTQLHLVYLKNGKKLKGRIIGIQNSDVFFLHKKNKINDTLDLAKISQIKVQGHLDGWERSYDDPNKYSQYLFFTNTAFGLKYKERNYRTFMGASMLYDYGLSNGVSIGAGYSFPLMFSANLKFSGKISPKVRLGIKSLAVSIPVLASSDDLFAIFENSLMITLGNPNKFLNLSYSNYYIKTNRFSFFGGPQFPTIYNSISIGSGIRLSQKWQFIFENHINFNNVILDAKLLPSFGISYTNNHHNIAFGYHSSNQIGFNTIPILDFNEDDIVVFANSFFSRLPYFTYSKIF